MPRPCVAVVLGGPTRNCPWTLGWAEAQLKGIAAGAKVPAASALLVMTRRTPPGVPAIARRAWAGLSHRLCTWPAPAEKYAAALCVADRLLVSADSVNLVSEACASGRPVHVLGGRFARGRLADFHRRLRAGGYALSDLDAGPGSTLVLRETAGVAARLLDSGLLG